MSIPRAATSLTAPTHVSVHGGTKNVGQEIDKGIGL